MNTSIRSRFAIQIPAERAEVLVSVNPKAGARSGTTVVEQLVEQLQAYGMHAEVITDIVQLRQTAAAKAEGGVLRAVVAAGGDGTVSLVVNEIPPGVPVAVLPQGTENLLAKYLKLKQDPIRLAQIIRDGNTASLDAGLANDKIFLLMAGCGFDAEVVRRLHSQRTGHINHLSYLKPILDSIRNYQYPELRVTPLDLDTGEPSDEPFSARWVFVVNLPRYAGGLSIAPNADGTDGRLDVCAFREGSLLSGLMYLGAIIAGQHQSRDDCVTLRTGRVRIESQEEVPFQVDGDPGGVIPVDIRVLPKRLTLVVAEDWEMQRE